MQWPQNGEHLPRGEKSVGVKNLWQEVCHCGTCGAGLVYVNKGRGNIYLTCSKSRRVLCGDHTHYDYPKPELELLDTLVLSDVSRIVAKAHPEADRIAALAAEITTKTATLDRLVEDFTADAPQAVSKRIATLSAEIEALEGQLADARRTTKIAEANENKDAYEEFRAMVDNLPAMPEGEERDQIRLRFASEIRRLVEDATAVNSELIFLLRLIPWGWQVGLAFDRARFVELRLVEQETGDSFAFSRAQLFGDSHFDFVGVFESLINRNRQAA
jgi:hypothetical protein